MNKCELVGRLTKDPELRLTSNQTAYCNFTIAVDRRFKDSNGQRQADFINCVAWKQTATFVQKYFHKGNRIGIVGSIQTRQYEDQQGAKHFVTEVIVDEAEFVESQTQTAPAPQTQAEPTQDNAPAEEAPAVGELPFEI